MTATITCVPPREMNDLKGASSRQLTKEFGAAKLDLGIASFWQHRYGFKVVPAEAAPAIQNYINAQWERLEEYGR